jgi:hypothetical protein
MDLSHPTVPAAMSVPKRATLFGVAAVVGFLGGLNWSVDLTNWAYYGLLQGFLDPRAQIANLAVGVALAYLVGFVHVCTV